MNISDRIFERLHELSMTQKEFSQETGIRQSTISEWKMKHTNPSAEKIMIICKVLKVSPEWLLSGIDTQGEYRNKPDWFVIDRKSEIGLLIESYNQLDEQSRKRMQGYMEALKEFSQTVKK